MKILALAILLTLLSTTVLCSAPAPARSNTIQVLVLDGESGGPYHNWQLTSRVLKKELEDAGSFEVTVATSPRFGEDFSNFKPDFSSYQAIVFNCDAPDWPLDLRQHLEQFVKNGGGLVIVHAADNAFPGWLAFNQMTGVGGWRGRSKNPARYGISTTANSSATILPGPPVPMEFVCLIRSPLAHPITQS